MQTHCRPAPRSKTRRDSIPALVIGLNLGCALIAVAFIVAHDSSPEVAHPIPQPGQRAISQPSTASHASEHSVDRPAQGDKAATDSSDQTDHASDSNSRPTGHRPESAVSHTFEQKSAANSSWPISFRDGPATLETVRSHPARVRAATSDSVNETEPVPPVAFTPRLIDERADGTVAAVLAPGQSKVPMPVAMLEPASTLQLNDDQLRDWTQLRNDFINAVGGVGQDPNDPSYLKRWQDARWQADQRFKMLFGWQAFLAQQRMANGN